MKKNWALYVDQCRLQALQFSVHLIDLLSILLICNDFARIQKAVVNQRSSRSPNSDQDLFLVQVWIWCKFGPKRFGPSWGFLGDASDKDLACQYKRKRKRCRFDPRVWKIPWRRKWQPTPIFLPGESHGQRSLAVYSPWGHKELGITERLTLSLSLSLTLRSALEFLLYLATELIITGSCTKSTFCRTSQSIREMVCCYTIKEDDTSSQWFF